MMKGRFERIKCSYGTPASLAIPTIPLPVTDLAPGLNFPNINVEGSSMTFSREELKVLFDNEIDNMLALTDSQFDIMQAKYPHSQIVR